VRLGKKMANLLKGMDCNGVKVMSFRYGLTRRLLSKDSSQGMFAKSGHALAKSFESRRRKRRRRKLVLVRML
jgi:hypothetical protein